MVSKGSHSISGVEERLGVRVDAPAPSVSSPCSAGPPTATSRVMGRHEALGSPQVLLVGGGEGEGGMPPHPASCESSPHIVHCSVFPPPP